MTRLLAPLCLAVLLSAAGNAIAQEADSSLPAAPQPPVPAADPAQAQADLEAAYQREYAFLAAQKAELERQLQAFRQSADAAVSEAEGAIDGLEGRVVGMQNRADRMNDLLTEADRRITDISDQRGVLDATYLQASSTLEQEGLDGFTGADFNSASDVDKIEQIFTSAADLITQSGQVRREPGAFFLTDGSEVQGTLIRVGNVAAYGVSQRGAGVLAPAGEGRLKLWPEQAEDTAKAIASGQAPQPLKIFLFESLLKPIEEKAKKTVLDTIDSGGLIAWIIAGLGLVALLLIILRVIFLRRAGADTSKMLEEVSPLVKAGRLGEAQEACKRRPGATSRVMGATLRNLNRDREHLEDIISEAILHESSHLNRFGAIILVIAAVSPLLGLLGTVTGMISTFDVITEFGTGDPKLLSGGISIALITTEVGLAVAIPALLFGNLLSGWAESIKDDMEKAALRIMNTEQERRLGSAG
ncbi:MAG: MotA/TolQ/ExbB proton channel family protein [Wenzhouxiangellaceae bacterium]